VVGTGRSSDGTRVGIGCADFVVVSLDGSNISGGIA
jgi:hypothetical protein